jgi:hypothetical protein
MKFFCAKISESKYFFLLPFNFFFAENYIKHKAQNGTNKDNLNVNKNLLLLSGEKNRKKRAR